jgi:multidrug transporter EmrE-like cation transporter
MLAYLFVFLALSFTVLGQIAMRWRAGLHGPVSGGDKWTYFIGMYSDPVIYAALLMGVGASICYALALEKLPLVVAYPIMALSFIIVPVLGRTLFSDALSIGQIFGMLLIVVGVSLAAGTGS